MYKKIFITVLSVFLVLSSQCIALAEELDPKIADHVIAGEVLVENLNHPDCIEGAKLPVDYQKGEIIRFTGVMVIGGTERLYSLKVDSGVKGWSFDDRTVFIKGACIKPIRIRDLKKTPPKNRTKSNRWKKFRYNGEDYYILLIASQ